MSDPTRGLWSTSTTRGRTFAPRCAPIRSGSSHAVSIPVSPAPTTTTVALAGVGGPAASRRRCGIELHCGVIGVDVEAEVAQARDVGSGDPAARREHQTVVAVGQAIGGDRVPRRVDRGHRGGDVADTDRVEHRRQRDSAVAQIRLVVAHPDVVKGAALNMAMVDPAGRYGKLVEPACRTERGPQSGEPGAQHQHAGGHVDILASPTAGLEMDVPSPVGGVRFSRYAGRSRQPPQPLTTRLNVPREPGDPLIAG